MKCRYREGGRKGHRTSWQRGEPCPLVEEQERENLKPFQISSPRISKQSVHSDPCQNIWPLIRLVLPSKFKQLPCEMGSLVADRISLLVMPWSRWHHRFWRSPPAPQCSLPSTAIEAQSMQPGLSTFECFNT